MSEWINYGDVSFADYGGVMVRPNEGSYDFFQLLIADDGGRYAFYGTVCNLSDYEDSEILKTEAEILGCKSSKELIAKNPEAAVNALVLNMTYGAMEFSATNQYGEGAYSLDMNDFKITEQELEAFMAKIDIPTEYWPVFEYKLTSRYEKDRGVEDTFKTNDWAGVETWTHKKCSKGNFVEIEDTEYAQNAILDPDRYIETFELRNGEFPVDERYLEVHYGDEED